MHRLRIIFRLSLSVKPILKPINKILRNLGQIIQFIAKSSFNYTINLFAPQATDLLEKLAEFLLYNFRREHILLRFKIKKILRKLVLKNLTAGV